MLAPHAKYSNYQLIEGIRRRDGEVFKYIDDEYRESIRIHIMTNHGSIEDAEDIYQDCIERIIQKVDISSFKLTCKFSTFLFAICKKKWLLVLDKRNIQQNYFIRRNEPDKDKDAGERLDYALYNGIFWESFNKLREVCKRILKACLKELSIKDIADVLDYTTGYLRKKKCLCHEDLFMQVTNHPEYKAIKEKEGSVKLY